jgi:hypothetical protein
MRLPEEVTKKREVTASPVAEGQRLSTFLVLVLLSLTASLAAPSSKLALCIARTPHESGARVSGDGAQLLRGHGRIDCFALRSSKR